MGYDRRVGLNDASGSVGAQFLLCLTLQPTKDRAVLFLIVAAQVESLEPRRKLVDEDVKVGALIFARTHAASEG